ncbi:NAD+ synthase [Inquilinus limosus]|uniref:Glutamine-dependent NAD(+) synthetase n=1 Tax=Inquilinus limosus MP06 TaxID=1398085 RepID=A0A0A0CY81_9PROT|nr:NAD+ synthase [Inquilinus limosus]KGM31411.1 NAD synthetase [Inquilinus limosus MP06]
MTDRLVIALAQLNPTLGDVRGNIDKLRRARDEARAAGADLLLASELAVSGYPPEDLVLKPFFLDAVEEGVRELAAETVEGPALLIGTPWRDDGRVHNAVLLLDGGKVAASRFKHDLPNYGVFDEKRVFAAGPMPGPIPFRGVRLGVPICEDIWTPDVVECLQETGAELLLVPNGSPYEAGKAEQRLQIVLNRVTESGLAMAYLNQVGGQDELVFDGASFVIGRNGALRRQLPSFREHIAITEWVRGEEGWDCVEGERIAPPEGVEAIYGAMVLGLRDYVNKNRFPGVLIGLSGGIDSALSAAVAVDALGADRVHCVMLPSPYTSQDSLDDAAGCADALGVRLDSISIAPAMQAFEAMLAPLFEGTAPDITEENIQSRARGVTLMALSNKFGKMVLTTGNKSEMSVGYATLYGDMCGGYSVLKDVYKTTVYELSRWRNQVLPEGAMGPAGRVIPERIITKAPTAELKPNQTDQDTLPPYDALDDILNCLVEEEKSVDEIVARGHDRATVARVWRLLDRAEYKRRQAPPGVKLTRRNFGRDRRYPITNSTLNLI